MKYLLIFLLALIPACNQAVVKKCQHEISKSKYSSYQEVGELLKTQSQGLSSETIYVVFAADYCGACKKLFRLLKDAGIEKEVVFIDIEKTWGFLFSREMNVSNVPSLAIINSNKTIQIREGLNDVLMYLVTHTGKKNRVELIQGVK